MNLKYDLTTQDRPFANDVSLIDDLLAADFTLARVPTWSQKSFGPSVQSHLFLGRL